MAITHSIFAYMALVFLVPNVCHSFNRKLNNYYNNNPYTYYNSPPPPPPNTYYNSPPPPSPNTYYNSPPPPSPNTYNNNPPPPPPNTYNNNPPPPPPNTYNNPSPPPNTHDNSSSQSDWMSTIATFYGDKDGAGSLGGACGYEEGVEWQPINSRIAAVEPSLYDEGFGCGLCYLITCNYPSCSGTQVKVVATDQCPEGACTQAHLFDLSGAAILDLARNGEEDQLRTIGNIQVQYKKVPCDFQGVYVTFRVDQGTGQNYFATSVEFESRGEISSISVKDATMTDWRGMTHSWGSVFMTVFDHAFVTPLSIQLSDGKQTITATNVIPDDYKKDTPYVSNVNFNS